MTQEQRNVLEFHRTFGLTVNEKPTEPSVADRILRAKLLLEETLETIRALGVCVIVVNPEKDFHACLESESNTLLFEESVIHKFDIIGVADGLADTKYVADGCAVTCGIDLEPVCEEVHRSNMSKLWTVSECATRQPDGIEATEARSFSSPFDRAYIIKRADGKVIKSPSYEPANIGAILEQQNK